MAVTLILAGLMVFTGVNMTKAYLGYRLSDREVKLSLEKSQNPYLHQVAQSSQQRDQLETQINTILNDSVPVDLLMEKINTYNGSGIDLINASFKLTGSTNDIRIRAKTSSRTDTENLLARLGKEPYFSKITSPLSNLSGKGERFINIDLVADVEKIINDQIILRSHRQSRKNLR
jgi:hypothetical protein